MKILHVFDHSVPLHSGYTFRSMNILKHQRARGWWTMHVTSPKQGGGAGTETVGDFTFHRTGRVPSAAKRVPGLSEFVVMRRLKRAIERLARAEAPDIIHAHSPALNGLPALAVGRKMGIPVVYEVRAFWEDAAVNHGTCREGGLRYHATRAVETRILRRAAHITTICEGLKYDITERGIAPQQVTVVPNAVDAEAFAVAAGRDAALEASLGLEGKTVIGFLGSFYTYEGLDLLIDAMPALMAAVPGVRLLLAGGGPQEANLRAQAEGLGLDDVVIFTGRVPHEDVRRYYALVDVLVFPRHSVRLTELVTPLKPLEGMAMGLPVIASDVGGHRELVRDGETGLLFKAEDAAGLVDTIVGLIESPDQRARIAAAGRKFVEEERTWTKSVARYEGVYAKALGIAG